MDKNLSLVCFFEAKEQPESEVDYMRDVTRDYIVRYNLFQDPDKYIKTTVDFARFCIAPRISQLGLAAACMYIAWLLFLDDSPENTAQVDLFSRVFQNDVSKDLKGSVRAVEELKTVTHQLAEANGLEPIEFGQRCIAMMQAQLWEQVTLAQERRPYSETEYSNYRPQTIGNSALLSLMKLDAGIDLEHLDPLAQARAGLLEELCNRLTSLSNDVLSHYRDENNPTELTIVRVLASKLGITWSEAVSQAIALHNREMNNYAHLRGEFLASSSDATIKRFIEITDADIAGNLAAMEAIRSRYQVTEQIPISWKRVPD